VLLIFNDGNRDAIELLKTHVAPIQAAVKAEVAKLHLRVEYLNDTFERAYPFLPQSAPPPARSGAVRSGDRQQASLPLADLHSASGGGDRKEEGRQRLPSSRRQKRNVASTPKVRGNARTR
jgi:hypothetical protein